MTQPLLCLSVRQPWAWLIVNGWKNIENREWPTQVRGRILIHAGKIMTADDYEACRIFICGFSESLAESLLFHMPDYDELQRGGIVGEAVILDCVTRHDSEWFCGRYGFVLDQQSTLPFEPLKGRLGFFQYPKAVTQ